jgi:hypothetical protein
MIYQNTKDCKLYDEMVLITDNETEEDKQDFIDMNFVHKCVVTMGKYLMPVKINHLQRSDIAFKWKDRDKNEQTKI